MRKVKRRVLKQQAVKYKGGQCENCGYNTCLAALTFHHRDKDQKEFNLSSIFHILTWDKIKIELDKCHLLCSNCHYEVHDGILDGYIDENSI